MNDSWESKDPRLSFYRPITLEWLALQPPLPSTFAWQILSKSIRIEEPALGLSRSPLLLIDVSLTANYTAVVL
jgi:hypothetical protein